MRKIPTWDELADGNNPFVRRGKNGEVEVMGVGEWVPLGEWPRTRETTEVNIPIVYTGKR